MVWKVIEGFAKEEVHSQVVLAQAAKNRRQAKRQRTTSKDRNDKLLTLCQQIQREEKDVPTFLEDVAALFRVIAEEEAQTRKLRK